MPLHPIRPSKLQAHLSKSLTPTILHFLLPFSAYKALPFTTQTQERAYPPPLAFPGVAAGDVVSRTKHISALARCGRPAEAVAAFARMEAAPNALTLASVLPACSQLRELILGKAIHGFWLRRAGGHGENVILDNAILDMYVKCGGLRSACYLFDEMPSRDVFSWTTMICGLARNGRSEEALAMFRTMLSDGEAMPNEATVVSVLRAVASSGSLFWGKLVHSNVLKRGLTDEQVVRNALINMYAKCGDSGMAFKVFEEHRWKDLVSWCTVMRGMAVHGRCREALQIFSLMLRHGVRPDGIAFLALLFACCHAGLVDQALIFFDAMWRVYGIVPQKAHYTCMLDACGRAGHFEKAGEIVRQMPVEHDRQVFGAYLSAWKVNGSAKVTCKRFREWFLDGEVEAGGGTYALMSQLLADAGRREDACALRDRMTARRIEKTAACSWIEV